MKVIIAGQSKTGTKSINAALKELGMNVYDGVEHFLYLENEWRQICQKGGTPENFRKMYQGVDAVIDAPAWYFWEELLEAFPEAKVVLTIRDETTWFKSVKKQTDALNNNIAMFFMQLFSPTYRRFLKFYYVVVGPTIMKMRSWSIFWDPSIKENLPIKQFRMHNAYVKQKTPKEKLLVYSVKEGWEPLCNFLEVEVPPKPFPHKNVRGEIVKEYMKSNPLFIRMQREMMVSAGVVAISLCVGCYKIFLKFFC